jgi:hypothetical protein
MDTFLETFWNLDQIHGWAETRDPELVREAALPRYGTPKKNGGRRYSCRVPSHPPVAWSTRYRRGIVGRKRMGAENCELRPIAGFSGICRAAWNAGLASLSL